MDNQEILLGIILLLLITAVHLRFKYVINSKIAKQDLIKLTESFDVTYQKPAFFWQSPRFEGAMQGHKVSVYETSVYKKNFVHKVIRIDLNQPTAQCVIFRRPKINFQKQNVKFRNPKIAHYYMAKSWHPKKATLLLNRPEITQILDLLMSHIKLGDEIVIYKQKLHL